MAFKPASEQFLSMNVDAMQVFTSFLALVALAGSVLVWILWLVSKKSNQAANLLAAISSIALPLAATVAVFATLGSLYFSEIANYTPCKLCWYQRIAMFPLAIVLPVAAFKKDRLVKRYVIPPALLGLCVSIYHYLIEWYPQLEKTQCAVEAPCTAVWFRGFDFVSLAFMAGSGFIAIITLLLTKEQPNQ